MTLSSLEFRVIESIGGYLGCMDRMCFIEIICWKQRRLGVRPFGSKAEIFG